MRTRSISRKTLLAAALATAAGAVGALGTGPAQAYPCEWVDCPPPEHQVVVPKIKWPPPVCLSCPIELRDKLQEVVLPESVLAGALNVNLANAAVVVGQP